MFENVLDSVKSKLSRYLNYVLILASILIAASLVRNLLRIRQANMKIIVAEETVVELRKDSEYLRSRVEKLKSDEYKEKQLRDKLGLAKEGEIIVVLPEDEILRKLTPKRVEEEETLPDPNWKKWLHLFGF
ncbi:MAG: septum formation initiator family protein [Patescibacteria group bacterium]